MIYIGDSDTDIPCMSLVNANGGHSIGVYDPDEQNKDKVYKMMRHHVYGIMRRLTIVKALILIR